ncbi:MAG: hypothetical protein AAF171_00235 [Cyanobacteria bacterium P01_A01_bin.116]
MFSSKRWLLGGSVCLGVVLTPLPALGQSVPDDVQSVGANAAHDADPTGDTIVIIESRSSYRFSEVVSGISYSGESQPVRIFRQQPNAVTEMTEASDTLSSDTSAQTD